MSGGNSILPDLSERLEYNTDDFPIFCKILDGANRCPEAEHYPCHWHPDIQLYYPMKGSGDYYINGEMLHIPEGNGLFINSRRLHYGFFPADTGFRTLTVTIHPSVFDGVSRSVRSYVMKRFSANSADYIVLRRDEPWEKAVLDRMLRLYEIFEADEPNPMEVLTLAAAICKELCAHIEPVEDTKKDAMKQMDYLRMADYISDNYGFKLTVDDIAKAGNVSRTKCNQLFQQFAHRSTNAYLTNFRLTKSIELLKNTNLNTTEIAYQCGFQTASYYNKLFKREFSLTPSQYRGMGT